MDKIQNIVDLLKIYNQEHIIEIIEKLEGKEKDELIEQILKIDFDQLKELYEQTKEEIEIKENVIEEIECIDKSRLSKIEKEQYEDKAVEILKNGQYAVVTMAGGQGTRLGHSGPKGTFRLDIYGKGKYLFEILAENLKAANKKYECNIPWYIMTSKENNEETVNFMEKNNYFGYDKNSVMFMIQNELPLLDFDGKVIFNKDYTIKEASDGNGGTYSVLRVSGALADMKERGIKWVFIGGVDNVLLDMVDTTFMGIVANSNKQIAAKTVAKIAPEERVGVFCKKNGKPGVIEYTELPEEMSVLRNIEGDLKYGESNIMANMYSIDAIEKISTEKLRYHYAVKKNSYMDSTGKEIVPNEPNTYKFESFIFDGFEFFEDMLLLRGKRENDFAPVKNREGVDSPKTAKELYEKYWEEQNRN